MKIERLNYMLDEGEISVEITVENAPLWWYKYKEDKAHENSSLHGAKIIHVLGKPHELKRLLHEWEFCLDNVSLKKIPDVKVSLKWYQNQNNKQVKIHEWSIDSITIDSESVKLIEDRLLLSSEG